MTRRQRNGDNKDEGEKEDLGRGMGSPWRVRGEDGTNGRHCHHHRLLDRSKVRILLCDSDAKSSQEILELLCNCSYQVTSVRTARQVIGTLNTQGPDIDIILTEVDLPISKGMKMLKCIMRDTELRRIPIITMSAKDEVSVVIKCLRLGAADYLVKPLRTNELLNLWTHMWRRRRMLGLAEKDVLSHEFDLLVSDTSDGNTNSTTLLSDDTDDKSRTMVLETRVSNIQEFKSKNSAVEPEIDMTLERQPDFLEDRDRTGRIISCPKKSELKVGESSAIFTYVKSSTPTNNSNRLDLIDGNTVSLESLSSEQRFLMSCEQAGGAERHSGVAWKGDRDGLVNGEKGAGISTFLVPVKFSAEWHLSRDQSHAAQSHLSDGQVDISRFPPCFHIPFYFSGMMRQNVMPSSEPLYRGSLHDLQMQGTPAVLPQYNALPHHPHVPMMPSFPNYPVGVGLQTGHMPSPHLWSMSSSSTPKVKYGRIERREAALIKFRQKRKDRCFDKKIRYVNRKRLAEKRPRVRGQFVRQVNGVDADLNGCPAAGGDFDEDEEEDKEPVPMDQGLGFSPEEHTILQNFDLPSDTR